MKARFFAAPRSERWIFESLTVWLAQRMANAYFGEPEQRSLTRLLYGLQMFPQISEELDITLSWQDDPDMECGANDDLYRESIKSIRYSEEGLVIAMGQTCLAYFEGSHYLRSFYDMLDGRERRDYLESWLGEFEDLAEPSTPVSIEDHSTPGQVDNPPLSAFWEPNTRILTDVLGDGTA
jgi:hypothetical protein